MIVGFWILPYDSEPNVPATVFYFRMFRDAPLGRPENCCCSNGLCQWHLLGCQAVESGETKIPYANCLGQSFEVANGCWILAQWRNPWAPLYLYASLMGDGWFSTRPRFWARCSFWNLLDTVGLNFNHWQQKARLLEVLLIVSTTDEAQDAF